MKRDRQNDIFEAMKLKTFYPHAVDSVKEMETHISRVFLAGSFVYKIKKAVDLGFLDFSSLKKRKYFCRQEVELNRRLTRKVYIDVVSISQEDSRYKIGGAGDPVEFAVKMRRLPDQCNMIHLLKQEKLDLHSFRRLGIFLAKFYDKTRSGSDIDEIGSWHTVLQNCHENFVQLEPFAGTFVDARRLKITRAATRAFLHRRKALFEKRKKDRKIRDCHGDLRTDHIYFTEEGIQIIDCIEFNERFRYGDITSDLAFLAMDLDFNGFETVGGDVLSAYMDYSGDHELSILIHFYKSYRALVRAKVNCFQLKENGLDSESEKKIIEKIRRYVQLGYRYAVEFTRPTLWIVCGMIATGKSTLAKELSAMLDIAVWRSDAVRKKMFEIEPGHRREAEFQQDIYTEHATALTYGKLLGLAQQEIEHGRSLILDASFAKRQWRAEAMRLAAEKDADIIFVECQAPEKILKKRLKHRNSRPSVSDARLKHLQSFKNGFEAFDEIPAGSRLQIDTSRPLQECMRDILASDFFLLSDAGQKKEK